ncbi:hypothetical protein AVEN_268281-1 [Araneus ventricosus]|uniref:Uncharacterized protein n=1 Tax=Araneus ventricosus TaxID=182803 RepID=A0A4Y2C3I5_ARAVE|nr:hypothetical protein AVEN_268281-1 [Araneus ventricosus]
MKGNWYMLVYTCDCLEARDVVEQERRSVTAFFLYKRKYENVLKTARLLSPRLERSNTAFRASITVYFAITPLLEALGRTPNSLNCSSKAEVALESARRGVTVSPTGGHDLLYEGTNAMKLISNFRQIFIFN